MSNSNIKVIITSQHYPAPDRLYIQRLIIDKLDDPSSRPEVTLRAGDFKINSPFISEPVEGVFYQKSIWVDGKPVSADSYEKFELEVSGLQPSSTSETYETDDHTISISWE